MQSDFMYLTSFYMNISLLYNNTSLFDYSYYCHMKEHTFTRKYFAVYNLHILILLVPFETKSSDPTENSTFALLQSGTSANTSSRVLLYLFICLHLDEVFRTIPVFPFMW